MKLEDIENGFMTDATNPGSNYSGNYFYSIALQRAKHIASEDREGLVTVISGWIKERQDHFAMLGVYLAEELGLTELIDDIEHLRHDIDSGKVFYTYYNERVERAIKVLHEAGL